MYVLLPGTIPPLCCLLFILLSKPLFCSHLKPSLAVTIFQYSLVCCSRVSRDRCISTCISRKRLNFFAQPTPDASPHLTIFVSRGFLTVDMQSALQAQPLDLIPRRSISILEPVGEWVSDYVSDQLQGLGVPRSPCGTGCQTHTQAEESGHVTLTRRGTGSVSTIRRCDRGNVTLQPNFDRP